MLYEHSDSEYKTDDTPLAAHLVTEGYSLKDVVFDGRIATYIFLYDPTCEPIIADFRNLEGTSSNASQLIDNYRYLVKRARKGF